MTEPVNPYAASPYLDGPMAVDSHRDNVALLTEPVPNQYGNIAALHLLFSLDSREDARGTLADIQQSNEARREAWERQLEAMKKQDEAEEDGGFWSDVANTLGTVAKVAGCIAAVALAVGTAGAGAPIACLAIAGALASCTSLAQSELGVLDGVCGEDADAVGQWLGIGGAVLSAGAGLAIWLGNGTKVGAELMGQLAQKTRHIAVGVGAVSLAGTAASGMAASQYAADARRHRAEVTAAMADQQQLRMLLSQLCEELGEAKERETRNVERVVAMNSYQSTGLLAAAQGVAG